MARNLKGDWLTCAHCECKFMGTYKQVWNFKHGKTPHPACSDLCRRARNGARQKPKRYSINCQTCGKAFATNTPNKKFCNMQCYTKSEAFGAMVKRNMAKGHATRKEAGPNKAGEDVPCLQCAKPVYRKPSDMIGPNKRKYCSKICYRKWMADRFDRAVVMPEELALPQCYDEFLTQQSLRCLIPGCDWVGDMLTLHVNLAHGIRSNDFKRAAGFNLGSGIISAPMAEQLGGRHLTGVAMPTFCHDNKKKGSHIRNYVSREGREHLMKARAMMTGPGPARTCKGCGVNFIQSTVMGVAKFCTIVCRNEFYREKKRVKNKQPRLRDARGLFMPKTPA